MHVCALSWNELAGWRHHGHDVSRADLVLYFGIRAALSDGLRYRELKGMYPEAHLVGCSTGGQIHDNDVSDEGITAVALKFDATSLRVVSEVVTGATQSFTCGESIGTRLREPDLAGVIVLSDGLSVNGSALVAGIARSVGDAVPLTGGLAGDGAAFSETLVGADDVPRSHIVAAIGFYGSAVRIGHGSEGGWDVFGPRRRVSRSSQNVLFELDDQPALDLYEKYLGDEANGLPGSALLFPLQIYDPRVPDSKLVRTVLAVDREARSMTFAGDVPEGWVAQLMRGNFDRLAAGAGEAARQARAGLNGAGDNEGVAILVSCIGRRLLMGQRTSEELDASASELGPRLAQIGFYSYGEIAPHSASGFCNLHNQTMTVTAISEASG